MTEKEMITKLEQMEDTIRSMIAQLRGNKELSPIQAAVRDITSSKSTRDKVKESLNLLCETPEQLSIKQTAFVVFFALLNRSELGEDIDYWFSIQIGKHKRSDRDSFLQQVWNVIDSNYNAKGDFKQRLKNYINSKKK